MNKVHRLTRGTRRAFFEVASQAAPVASLRDGRNIPPASRRPLYAALVAAGLGSFAVPALGQTCPTSVSVCAAAGGGVQNDRAGLGGAGNGQGGYSENGSFAPRAPIPGALSSAGVGGDGATGIDVDGTPRGVGGPGGAPGDPNGVWAGVRGGDGGADLHAPGGGGGGGAGVWLDGLGASVNMQGTTATGGAGGTGGVPQMAAGGGGGGGGGAGLVGTFADSFLLTIDPAARITGGAGGDGGGAPGTAQTWGGGGGGGGDGVLLTGTNASVLNGGTILGGAGGAGGLGSVANGADGASGAGIRAWASGLMVVNNGVIQGGDGTGSGAAGVGIITQAGASISNAGLLAGGASAGGRAASVLFNGGGNSLDLGTGSQVQGVIEVAPAAAARVTTSVGGSLDGAQLDGAGAQLALQPNASGLDLGGAITGTGAVTSTGSGQVRLRGVALGGSLDMGAAGGTFMSGTIDTTGMQHYAAPVSLDADTSILTQGSNVTFDSTLDGTHALSIDTSGGTLTASGSIGAVTPLASLTVNAGTLSLQNNVAAGSLSLTATSDIVQTSGAFTVMGSTTLSTPGNVTLNGAANNFGGNLRVDAHDINIASQGLLEVVHAHGNDVTLNSATQIDAGDITAAGTLHLLTDGSVFQTGSIDAASLTASVRGQMTLGSPSNTIRSVGDVDANIFYIANTVPMTMPGTVTASVVGLDDSQGITLTGSLNASSTTVGSLTTLSVGNGGTTGAVNGDILLFGTLSYDHSDNVVYSHQLAGSGHLVQAGTGNLLFDGDGSQFQGDTVVKSGGLIVGSTAGSSADLHGSVAVSDGASLGGHGRIEGNVDLASGATLSPGNSIGTLTVAGDLHMAQGSIMDAELGTPGVGDSAHVTGNLALDGVTLNVSDAGGMAPGLYNVFTYGGALTETNGGIQFGSTPAGSTLQLETLTGSKQINIVDSTGTTLQFWNADHLAGPTQRGGGSGTWSVTSPVWTDAVGTVTGPMTPQPGFAIFAGAPGLVTVDGSAGAVTASGMQFASDGYRLAGDPVALVGASGPVVVSVGDGSVASAGYTATIDSALTGSQGLRKTQAGTLVLNGANSYTGGTTISAGTIAVSDDRNLGDAGNDVVLDGGALRVNGTSYTSTGRSLSLLAGGAVDIDDASNTFTWSGVASGPGALEKTGAGTLVLTGANTYAGGTVITAGTLVGNTTSLQGNIANNAALVFDQAGDGVYAGTLSGSGLLTKQGLGTLTVASDSGAFNGSTSLAAGTLEVDGNLGGTLTAMAGTTLSGTGTVGSTTIASHATLSPGNAATPIGTLNVNGDITFAPGSIYRVDTTVAGAHDSVHATGTAHLAGSVIDVGQNGNYAASTSYTILSADRGVQDTFGDVSSNLAFLTPTLEYDANDVNLVMQLKQTGGGGSQPIQFADLAQTPNQRATANGLQSLPANNALYQRVLNLPNGAPPAVFNALSGEIHPTTTGILQGVADHVAGAALAHLHDNLTAGQLPGAPTARLGQGDAASLPQSAARPLWAEVFGNWHTVDGTGDGNTAKVKDTDAGLFVGGDGSVGNGWRLGGALGYTDSDVDIHGRSSSSDVDSYTAAIYGGKAFDAGAGKIDLSVGAAYTWHDIDTRRHPDAAGISETLKSSYGASTAQVFTELGYAVPLNSSTTLEPFIGADYSDLHTRAFSESGGDAALDGDSDRNPIASTTLGLHAQTTFESAGMQGRLKGTLGWRHAFGDVNPTTTMAFDGGQPFTITGAPIAQNAAVLQVGVDMSITRHTTVGVSYSGQFGDHNQQNAGSLNVKYVF